MATFTSSRRALSAATLFIALSRAQTCYYPDGKTIATGHVACSTGGASSCCDSDAFCLANGLCFGDGMMSRGSCTDSTWASEACTSFCTTYSPNTNITLTPCFDSAADGTGIFACGLNTTSCQTGTNTFSVSGGSSLVLRTDQVTALLGSVIESSPSSNASSSSTSSSTSTPTTTSSGAYSLGTVIGVACGIGIPLLIAAIIFFLLLRHEKTRHRPLTHMYQVPDNDTKREPSNPYLGSTNDSRMSSGVLTNPTTITASTLSQSHRPTLNPLQQHPTNGTNPSNHPRNTLLPEGSRTLTALPSPSYPYPRPSSSSASTTNGFATPRSTHSFTTTTTGTATTAAVYSGGRRLSSRGNNSTSNNNTSTTHSPALSPMVSPAAIGANGAKDMQTFLERYEAMKRKGELLDANRAGAGAAGGVRHELDSGPANFAHEKKYELGDTGVSLKKDNRGEGG